MSNKSKAGGANLPIAPDGTLYHIDLKKADNIPPNIFLVGASGRVDFIAKEFDDVTFEHVNNHSDNERPEFHIIAGSYRNVPMAVMSCGIGVDNMEIVINELHALFEYDHKTGEWSEKPANLNLIRVGTCGTSSPDILNGTLAISQYGLGLDNLGAYYPIDNKNKAQLEIEKKVLNTKLGKINPLCYCSRATPRVVDYLVDSCSRLGETPDTIKIGITTASPGFYGPEGRGIGRIKPAISLSQFISIMQKLGVLNHEMETSIMFRLCELLEYNAGAICLILDNLATDEMMMDKSITRLRMKKCVHVALDAMVRLVNE